LPSSIVEGFSNNKGLLVSIGDGASAWWNPLTTDGDALRLAVTLGLLIYDKYIYLFQASGLVLLVAMIGAILLTLRHRKDVKRQNVLQQMWRDPAKAMELKDVKPGQGL
jgi:NADH-quinone oxidoreductase subunit J